MDDFCDILDLERRSYSKKDARRAYAKLIKIHRPEDDPAAFQRIHQAYQDALEYLEYRSDDGDDYDYHQEAFSSYTIPNDSTDTEAEASAPSAKMHQLDADFIIEQTKSTDPEPVHKMHQLDADIVVEQTAADHQDVDHHMHRLDDDIVLEQAAADRQQAEAAPFQALSGDQLESPDTQDQEDLQWDFLSSSAQDHLHKPDQLLLDVLAMLAFANQHHEYWYLCERFLLELHHTHRVFAAISAKLPAHQYINCLRFDCEELYRCIIDCLYEHQHYDALIALLSELNAQLYHDNDPLLLSSCDQLLRYCALLDADGSQQLIELAWELEAEIDAYIDDETEIAVMAGTEIEEWPFEQRVLLIELIKKEHNKKQFKKNPYANLLAALVALDSQSAIRTHLLQSNYDLGRYINKKDGYGTVFSCSWIMIFFLIIILNLVRSCT